MVYSAFKDDKSKYYIEKGRVNQNMVVKSS